jgi:hypothetical protein
VSLLIFIERNLVVLIESICDDDDDDDEASHAQALIAKDEHLVSPWFGLYGKRNEIDCWVYVLAVAVAAAAAVAS